MPLMCWTCGGVLAVNLKCDHLNPNPERLAQAKAQLAQKLTCPDCAAELSVVVEDGQVQIIRAIHRT